VLWWSEARRNGLGGGGDDGEPIFGGGEAQEVRSGACNGEGWMAVLDASGDG
jgi:hypothetical protein